MQLNIECEKFEFSVKYMLRSKIAFRCNCKTLHTKRFNAVDVREKLSHECPRDKKGQKNCVPRVSGAQTRDKIDSHNRKETSNKPP